MRDISEIKEGRITSVEKANQFIFAGKSTFTIRSKKTGTRFTFKVAETEDNQHRHFVSVLTGQDNSADYKYLGMFFGPDFVQTKGSKISREAPSAVAFQWFAKQLKKPALPDQLEIWHEGRCGRCNRPLTVPASIHTGLGPDCAEQMGVIWCEKVQEDEFLDLPSEKKEPKKLTKKQKADLEVGQVNAEKNAKRKRSYVRRK